MQDILSELSRRGCRHLVLRILQHLNSWELEIVAHVSSLWRKIVFDTFWRSRRVKNRIRTRKLTGVCSFNNITLTFQEQVVSAGCVDYSTLDRYSKTNFYLVWFVLLSPEEICYVEEWLIFGELHQVRRVKIGTVQKVSCADYLDDLLVLGDVSGQLRIYQLCRQTSSFVSLVSTHSKAVLKVLITDSMILSCGEDCSVTVIKITSSGSLKITNILQGHVSRVRSLSISESSSLLLTGSDDRTARLWDLDSDSNRAIRTLSPHRWGVMQVKLTGNLCYTVDSKDILVWNLSGNLLTRLELQYVPSVLCRDRDINCLLIGDTGGYLSVFSLRDILDKRLNLEDKEREKEKAHCLWRLSTGPEKSPSGDISVGISTLIFLSFNSRSNQVHLTLNDYI